MSKKGITTFVFLFLICFTKPIYAQIIGVNYAKQISTNYTDGKPNDAIYIWNSDELGKQQGQLKITPKTGVAPYVFDWFYHDEKTFSWMRYKTETGTFSALNNLPTDGYRVQVTDATGKQIEHHVAWVWNFNVATRAKAELLSCSEVAYEALVDAEVNFVYYNLPPPEAIITPKTKITVEFNANHTYISDLAFYLIGPAAAGSPRILLSPNPGALSVYRDVCNSGNDVRDLAFSNSATAALDVCDAVAPLSGLYGAYAQMGKKYEINWSALQGVNAAIGDWAVQIYDCILMDKGFLKSAKITFTDLESKFGSPTTITYDSGEIRSQINDMSCSPETASIFNVPPHYYYTQPIVIEADVVSKWLLNDEQLAAANTGVAKQLMTGTHTFTYVTEAFLNQDSVFKNLYTQAFTTGSSISVPNQQVFCYNDKATVKNLASETDQLKWFLSATGTTALDADALLQTGTYYAEQLTPSCTAERIAVLVFVMQVDAPKAEDQIFCTATATVGDLKAEGSVLKWYENEVGGTALATDLLLTERIYYVSQVQNGCESIDRTAVQVVFQQIQAPVFFASNVCFTDQNTLADLTVDGQNLQFYAELTSVDPLPITTKLEKKTYYVSQKNGTCESERLPISITIFPAINLSDYKEQVICSGQEFQLDFSLYETEGLTYKWEVQTENVVGATAGTGNNIKQVLKTNQLQNGKVIYKVTPIVKQCEGEPFYIPVQVHATANVVATANTNMICSGESVTITLTSNFANTVFEWEVLNNEVSGANSGSGNAINNTLFTQSQNGFVVYKITPYINGCAGEPVEVEVFVNPLSHLQLENGTLCYDSQTGKILSPYILNSGLAEADFSFEWFFENELLANENKSSLKVYNPGQYKLKITNKLGCESEQIVQVSANQSVQSATYALTNYFQDSQTITVNVQGSGNYLYQLNNLPPQKSNVFNRVFPGTHQVIITDEYDCTYIVLDNIVTIHYPNFFTPNGDGVNDYWNIWSLKEKSNAEIFIYDRYGKLIKVITPESEGWDGSLRGTSTIYRLLVCGKLYRR
ncbi:T9SS type B sorting domain-containing protein [Flavobacterium agricola]|uniref:T9SS type B sorting domain-containing protein n=1 Tax=Flavobacterium agricola TaxID=2870839 RepID=A0ABY6LZC4_9FLAO|nr:T9SS type B sorting domain-containing protein [Flavobacterium agricola]UYW01669.1 T9SS type B sorting domain-containing protein [Flavobacterium agricola]